MRLIIMLLLGIFSLIEYSYAGCAFWICKVDPIIKWTGDADILNAVDPVILYFLSFVAFIWVAFVIKGWFQIVVAWWDEEKVKAWRKTVLFALLWLFVIVAAYTIVITTMGALDSTKI